MRRVSVAAVVLVAALAVPELSYANATGVGLGVAGGVAWSGSKIDVNQVKEEVGARPAWGFFVDIPLLSTFYISPAAMLYKFKNPAGGNDLSVTDVDLNFKFIIPIGDLHLGAGVTAGLSSGLQEGYAPHYGLLGYASYNLVANLDGFVMVQYKKLTRESASSIDDVHGFVGAMFRF